MSIPSLYVYYQDPPNGALECKVDGVARTTVVTIASPVVMTDESGMTTLTYEAALVSMVRGGGPTATAANMTAPVEAVIKEEVVVCDDEYAVSLFIDSAGCDCRSGFVDIEQCPGFESDCQYLSENYCFPAGSKYGCPERMHEALAVLFDFCTNFDAGPGCPPPMVSIEQCYPGFDPDFCAKEVFATRRATVNAMTGGTRSLGEDCLSVLIVNRVRSTKRTALWKGEMPHYYSRSSHQQSQEFRGNGFPYTPRVVMGEKLRGRLDVVDDAVLACKALLHSSIIVVQVQACFAGASRLVLCRMLQYRRQPPCFPSREALALLTRMTH